MTSPRSDRAVLLLIWIVCAVAIVVGLTLIQKAVRG